MTHPTATRRSKNSTCSSTPSCPTGHAQAIHHHLDSCPDCLSAYDFHAELKQVIHKKCQENEMPADLLSRIEKCFDTDFDSDGIIG